MVILLITEKQPHFIIRCIFRYNVVPSVGQTIYEKLNLFWIIQILSFPFPGEIDLKEVKVHNSKEHLKDIEDKVSQLVNEVGKLQTQLAAMSSSVNGTQFGGQHTPHF